jgi:hypothetical protein
MNEGGNWSVECIGKSFFLLADPRASVHCPQKQSETHLKGVSNLTTQGSRANDGKIRHGLQYGALSTLAHVLEVGNENALSVFASR